jgi:putative methylase
LGKLTQRRLLRKLDLELFLSQIPPPPSPKVNLEQYTTPNDAAATALHTAAYTYGDIIGKTVLDLGCGTGKLGLLAAFMGAKLVVGVDVDASSVRIAHNNAHALGLSSKTEWVIGDIDVIFGKFDAVLQNPPFGVQKRTADRKFLKKALEVGSTVYSFHNHPIRDVKLLSLLKAKSRCVLKISPSQFIRKIVEESNGKIEAVYAILFTMPHMFQFHTRHKYNYVVDFYVIKRVS